MKALLYKEFKLAWHPLCYVFPILFSLLSIIPNYPPWVGMGLVGVTYTILFLGANKGKQTNDLYYSINLPVKKQDIVIARFISMLVMQLITIVITCACAPISKLIFEAINNATGKASPTVGFNYQYIGLVIAFGLIGFIVVDALYLLMYYKNGRSIVAPSLIGIFAFMVFMLILTTILPMVAESYKAFFTNKIWTQAICVAIALVIYVISHIFILKGAIKRIKKINF